MEHSAYPFGRSIEHIENKKDKFWENNMPFPETVSTYYKRQQYPCQSQNYQVYEYPA
jgi:hypothetical protein